MIGWQEVRAAARHRQCPPLLPGRVLQVSCRSAVPAEPKYSEPAWRVRQEGGERPCELREASRAVGLYFLQAMIWGWVYLIRPHGTEAAAGCPKCRHPALLTRHSAAGWWEEQAPPIRPAALLRISIAAWLNRQDNQEAPPWV